MYTYSTEERNGITLVRNDQTGKFVHSFDTPEDAQRWISLVQAAIQH